MKYIDAEKLKELIDEKWKELADKNVKVGGGKWDVEISTYLSVLRLIDSLQQEQPEVDLDKEIEEWIIKGREDFELDGWVAMGVDCIARHFYGLRNRALEEAARHVYESWMGGTMDDVRRDIVELGTALNARK